MLYQVELMYCPDCMKETGLDSMTIVALVIRREYYYEIIGENIWEGMLGAVLQRKSDVLRCLAK